MVILCISMTMFVFISTTLLFPLLLALQFPDTVISDDLQFIVLGDWGDAFYDVPSPQLQVAAAMEEWASRNGSNPQFIITVADNFYPDGVTSPTDEWFDTKWKYVYNKTHIQDLPWYISLGNHDYDPHEEREGPNSGGREMNQIRRSEIDPQWILPALWYSFSVDSPAGEVEFFVIDSDAIKEHLNNYTDEIVWINTVIPESIAAVKFVVGHHPIYTIGSRAPGEDSIKEVLEPVMIESGVDAYIAGHEHNFQHIRKRNETEPDHFIFGGGGRGITRKNPVAEGLFNANGFDTFFHYGYGFGVITVTEDRIITQSYGVDNAELVYEDIRMIQ